MSMPVPTAHDCRRVLHGKFGDGLIINRHTWNLNHASALEFMQRLNLHGNPSCRNHQCFRLAGFDA